VGLRVKLFDWILGDYIETKLSQIGVSNEVLAEVANLREKVAALEERLNKIEDDITSWMQQNENGKAAVEELTGKVEELAKEIAEIKEKIEGTHSSESGNNEDLDELERKVLELIQQGYTTPVKLRQALGVSTTKLQRVLDNLLKARLIERERRGRKIVLVPASDGEQ